MAFTVDIYVEEAADPGVWTQIADDFNAAFGVFGWEYPAPGTYRFRVELYEDAVLIYTAYSAFITAGRSRVLTDGMRAILGGSQRRDRTWLFVEDADGVQRDRSSYLTGFDIAYDLNSHTGNATVQIRREHGVASLAPDVETSVLNRRQDGSYGSAIEIGRHFTIWVAPTPADVVPTFADHAILLFCGDIDKHDFADSDASFLGRDMGGRLEEWIEEKRSYGAPEPGQPVQEIIAEILIDNKPDVFVFVPTDIDIELGVFDQEKAILFEALRWWALQAGADLRYLWDDVTGAFRLTLYQPGDGLGAPEYVFGKDEWYVVNTYERAIYDIRNAVAGSFLDDAGERVVADTLVDPASIEKYRRRKWMEFELGTDSAIRTLPPMEALQNAALVALSEPDALMEIGVPMFWPAGLNRMYGFEADGLRFVAQRNLACIGYRHAYRAGEGNMDGIWDSFLTVRAKPAAANREFFTRERRPETPTLPPGEQPPGTPLPPDPAAERLSSASAGNSIESIFYDVPPALVTVFWTVENPAGAGHLINIDRQINTDGWVEDIATGLGLTAGTYEDAVDGFVNRPAATPPPVTHRVFYRVKIMDGVTVLDYRTTGGLVIHPA